LGTGSKTWTRFITDFCISMGKLAFLKNAIMFCVRIRESTSSTEPFWRGLGATWQISCLKETIMDFSIPAEMKDEVQSFKTFIEANLASRLSTWYEERSVPRQFFSAVAQGGWLDFAMKDKHIVKKSAVRSALLMEQLAMVSPGVAVAILAHEDLGLTCLWLFGTDKLQGLYGPAAVHGETLMGIGNTEGIAGSDAAGVAMAAEKAEGGWVLNGAKAYVTNGYLADLAVVTAVTDPQAPRNNRISMFLVDLKSTGATRTKLNKQVWIPSDLTRLHFTDVFVPEDHLMGMRGKGLQQVLTTFTYSRVPISALTMGTAMGALKLAVDHGLKRKTFGKKILDHQAKAFEMADLYSRIEAARLMVFKACSMMDRGEDFHLESSMAKYLAVMTAREVTAWAADLYGAASVIYEHPIYKFPMDAWASSLGEGTQDVQKLVIFREAIKRFQ
jgi:alkylation response protein AidB-like acyl-CoA dehydrogenase